MHSSDPFARVVLNNIVFTANANDCDGVLLETRAGKRGKIRCVETWTPLDPFLGF